MQALAPDRLGIEAQVLEIHEEHNTRQKRRPQYSALVVERLSPMDSEGHYIIPAPLPFRPTSM